MKLNATKFFTDTRVVSVSEQGIVYDLPKDRIQEVWDKLGAYYTEKTKNEHKSEMQIEDFYRSLALAKGENEAALEVFELVNRGIIECYDATETKDVKFNIKRIVIEGVLKVLKHRMIELHENIENERRTYSKLKDVNKAILIVDGIIRIHTSPFSSVSLDQALNRNECSGLLCIVKYGDMEYKGCFAYPPDELLTVDLSTFVRKFEKGRLSIEIKNEVSESKHPICTAILRELLDGRPIQLIFKHIPVLLSRFHVNEITRDINKKTVIQTKTKTLIDKYSSVFYVITEDSVLKVKRDDFGFSIYQNGIMKYG